MRQISITCCGTCNYRPIAASLARVIEAENGIKPVLIHSSDRGAFEVTVNDDLIFPTHAAGRFPVFSKIVAAVAGKRGSSA